MRCMDSFHSSYKVATTDRAMMMMKDLPLSHLQSIKCVFTPPGNGGSERI